MRRGTTLLAGFALALALALPCSAEERQLPTQTVTISGTIATIDHNTRAMNIKTDDGDFVSVNAPQSLSRFNELKVGDHVKATYNNNVNVRLKPPGEAAIDSIASSLHMTSDTAGTKTMERKMTATVTALDPNASSITFEGANGWKYSRHVVDPTVFDQVKVGDRVDISWNTDLSVEVAR